MVRKLNYYDFTMTILSSVIGIGILSIPRRAVEGSGAAGILSTLLGGVIFAFLAFMFSKFSQRFQNQTIIEASKSLIGKYLTAILSLFMTLYFILIVSLQLRTIGHSIKQNLLFDTPLEVIILSILFVVAIASHNGFQVISKLASFLTIFTVSILLLLLLPSLRYFSIENLYPIFSTSLGKIMEGSFKLSLDYIGFEVILFITPLLASSKKIPKFSVISMLIITLVYSSVVIVSFGEFGLTGNQYILEPTSIMPKALSFGGIPFRIDIFFILFWVVANFLSMSFMFSMGTYSMSKIIYKSDYRVFIFLAVPFAYILSLIPQNLAQANIVTNIITYMAWFGVFPAVLVLYVLSFFKKPRKSKSAI